MLCFLCIPILAIIVLILSVIWWYTTIPPNLPPGPLGLPFLGSALDTRKAAQVHHKLHEWTRIYGPLYKFYVADKLVIVLGDWNMIQDSLVKQGDVFAGRPHIAFSAKDDLYGNGLVHNQGEIQKSLRRFALSTMRDFGLGKPILEPRIKDEANQLMEDFDSHQERPFDPTNVISEAICNVICALVFGQPFDPNDQQFQNLMANLRMVLTESRVSFLTPYILSQRVMRIVSLVPEVKKFHKKILDTDNFVKKGVEIAMKDFDVEHDEPSNFIQAFSKAQSEKGDNDPAFAHCHLYRSIMDLFTAGTDTTATTLRWTIFYLAHYQEIQEKVYIEIKDQFGEDLSNINYGDRKKLPFTEATIMETQRMSNLLPISVMRETMAPCKVGGYDIPSGTAVVPLLTAILNDPNVYPDPNTFDPTRFLKDECGIKNDQAAYLIPFGAGKRVCLGESLARMELFHFFTTAVSKFKFIFSPIEPIPPANGERVGFFRVPPVYKICAMKRQA